MGLIRVTSTYWTEPSTTTRNHYSCTGVCVSVEVLVVVEKTSANNYLVTENMRLAEYLRLTV